LSILVVGSVAYDSVKTPAGSREDSLGGSATFFSVSCSYFAPVSVVAVVGEDFRNSDVELLESRGVDVSGLERRPGKTFRWSGVYGAEDVNTRETLDTQLNVFAEFAPKLSPEHRSKPYLFLANIAPELQMEVLDQMEERPKLVALDSMALWIDIGHEALERIIRKVDVLFLDEGEIRSFTKRTNLVEAVREIMAMGPSTVVAKRGDHGVLMFHGDSIFSAPAFPLERVVDPTGAGDTFAGGFMGYLAATGDLTTEGFKLAAMAGSVMGSFNVESFSLERTASLTNDEIETRFRALTDLTRFTPLRDNESLPFHSGAAHA
jgi:sugar/nucleoside kinase (ribokinase family)